MAWCNKQAIIWINIDQDAWHQWFHFSPPGQNGRHFADDVSKCIFMNEKFCILNRLSLRFVPKGLINIIWTNADPVHWRIHALLAPSSDEVLCGHMHISQHCFGRRRCGCAQTAPSTLNPCLNKSSLIKISVVGSRYKTVRHITAVTEILRMILTLILQGSIFSGSTLPISYLLMPWQRKEPGHQQRWYWLWRV